MNNNPLSVLGIMSGSSLDGLDLAICRFSKKNGNWLFNFVDGKTIPYSAEWKVILEKAPDLDGQHLKDLDAKYGKFIAEQVMKYLSEVNIDVDMISSHGHTIYHQPEKGITMQIGSGAEISAITSLTTICDFRSTDVALGGQGAPLVPVGDELLFNQYDYCLNLGGFANISFSNAGQRIAFDICPVNTVLNRLAQQMGQQYDHDGNTGRTGQTDKDLLEKLNALPYYRREAPKSLGKEWLIHEFSPVIDHSSIPINNKIRTVYEHIAYQISRIPKKDKNIFITGGGAHNKFLIEMIRKFSKADCILPESNIIDYKEAIIFAFLGLLRVHGEINCLASVTGASRDSCCGAVYLGINRTVTK
ncbi:MAG: hypothetical protein AMS27_08625 [Bacteroides sp. SM23_62_1]|nr:MAG: hypothetical protein AMS27_08625 [Bacteroides sp. SM23_62_1]